MRRTALVLLAVVAAGCVLKRSVPPKIYVLDARAAAPSGAPATAGVVGLQRVSIPAWIDRPELTDRTVGGEVDPHEDARWGEPLARGVQRVVMENLAVLLPGRELVAAPFPPRQPVDHRLEITVAELARQADGTVKLEARWRVIGTDGLTVLQRRSSITAPATAGHPGTVAAFGDALAQLSAEIADAVRTLPAK